MKTIKFERESGLDWVSNKQGRNFNKPTFGDTLDVRDVLGLRKKYPAKKVKVLKNRPKNHKKYPNIGYNKTTVELLTGEPSKAEGIIAPKVKQVTLGGYISLKTLIKKWGKDAIHALWYEDTRTERCSEVILLGKKPIIS